jgi:prolyl-tRNA synthetase
MRIKDRRGAEFALGGTAEEMFVDVVRKFKLSYRDLPFNIYQFSTKFRDELRARGGLLRLREFIMKDAYSFSRDEKEFKVEYDKMAEAYTCIFKRLGLNTLKVEADNGYIGGEYCHEYQAEHPEGEGRFFVSSNGDYCAHEDVAKFKREDVGMDEEVKDMKVIDQPEWVKTMEDNVKHYNLPKGKFLKNVVYRHVKTGDIIIAVIRGDLEVNKTKLEHVLNAVGQLVEANDEDLAKIGTKRGYVHSWGHENAKNVGDISLKQVRNLVGGQKDENKDTVDVNYGRDFECEILADIAMAQAGSKTEDGNGVLEEKRGIEVGNIFQLGYHYTKLMTGANFVDEDGKEKPYYMGCYGIGLGRTMAAIAEVYHDEKGLVWPKQVAPFQVHLVTLKGGEEQGQKIYDGLIAKGIDVLWDDRDESPGVKFSDADLIGIPIRLVVSARTGDKVEYKLRNEKESSLLSIEEAINKL